VLVFLTNFVTVLVSGPQYVNVACFVSCVSRELFVRGLWLRFGSIIC
jgi:hypothetical protein